MQWLWLGKIFPSPFCIWGLYRLTVVFRRLRLCGRFSPRPFEECICVSCLSFQYWCVNLWSSLHSCNVSNYVYIYTPRDFVPGSSEKSLYHVASCWFCGSELKLGPSCRLIDLRPPPTEAQVVFAHVFGFILWQFKGHRFTVLCMKA